MGKIPEWWQKACKEKGYNLSQNNYKNPDYVHERLLENQRRVDKRIEKINQSEIKALEKLDAKFLKERIISNTVDDLRRDAYEADRSLLKQQKKIALQVALLENIITEYETKMEEFEDEKSSEADDVLFDPYLEIDIDMGMFDPYDDFPETTKQYKSKKEYWKNVIDTLYELQWELEDKVMDLENRRKILDERNENKISNLEEQTEAEFR
mgnify:CR=1 FL=1